MLFPILQGTKTNIQAQLKESSPQIGHSINSNRFIHNKLCNEIYQDFLEKRIQISLTIMDKCLNLDHNSSTFVLTVIARYSCNNLHKNQKTVIKHLKECKIRV